MPRSVRVRLSIPRNLLVSAPLPVLLNVRKARLGDEIFALQAKTIILYHHRVLVQISIAMNTYFV